MKINFVEPNEIRVNPDAIINNKNIGEKNHPLIVVDDFLLNPDQLVNDYTRHIPVALNTLNSESVIPGWYGELPHRFIEIDTSINHLIHLFTDITLSDKEINTFSWSYQLNVLAGGVQCARKSVQPHVDPAMFAWVLYLNPEEECKGGTSFYRHSEAGDMNLEYVERSWKRTTEYWKYKEWQFEKIRNHENEYVDLDVNSMDDSWEEYHFVNMKYNRLVLYPSYIFHSAQIKKDWFVEYPRVSISGFIKSSYFT
tara:strand:+ start:1068 stop:1829 length:762 start_codon:yes stop_codon:yes gene_type:complete